MLLRDRTDCQKECKTFSGNDLRDCQRNRNYKRNADLQETGNRNFSGADGRNYRTHAEGRCGRRYDFTMEYAGKRLELERDKWRRYESGNK